MENLQAVKDFATEIYYEWVLKGCPEASDALNDGNRKVISAYMNLYPNAKGYKFHEGIVELRENVANFFCDWVFSGSALSVRRIHMLEKSYKQTHDPTYIMLALEQADGICLVWS